MRMHFIGCHLFLDGTASKLISHYHRIVLTYLQSITWHQHKWFKILSNRIDSNAWRNLVGGIDTLFEIMSDFSVIEEVCSKSIDLLWQTNKIKK